MTASGAVGVGGLNKVTPAERRDWCPGLAGDSPAVSSLRTAIRVVSPSSTAVLISGETGTFKELIARMLHEMSPRCERPFVKVRCGSVSESELEADLFGNLGTGSNIAFTGKLALEADGGTLFFDEVSNVPLRIQGQLVDAIRRMGTHDSGELDAREFDCRVVAATTRDLRRLADNGEFRADLYYLLAVVPLKVPPLRSRGEDIPMLVQAFVDRSSTKGGRPGPRMPVKALSAFSHYHWPGNLRELECVVERLVALSRGDTLDVRQLPARIRMPRRTGSSKLQLPPEGANLNVVEKDLIFQALERHDGNRTHAAKTLGISRNTLLYRMRKHGLR